MEQAKKKDQALSEAPEGVSEKAKSFFWFVAQGSLLKGPYSTFELKKLLEKKELSDKLFAWRDGFKEWRPLYGIDEFHIEKSQAEEVAYPTIPTPGATTAVVNPELSPSRNTRIPVYKVRFSRSRWSDMKKSEVVGFFALSLVFTLCILMLTGYFFQKQWEKVWGERSSGILYHAGYAPDALPLYMIDPLLSAPGLRNQEENFTAVEIEGDVGRFENDQLLGRKIVSNLPPEHFGDLSWDKSHTYTRRIRVQGYLNLQRPELLVVEEQGMPYEPILSPRRLPERLSHP